MNRSSAQQTIDGFGASSGGDLNKLSPALMDVFYSNSDNHYHSNVTDAGAIGNRVSEFSAYDGSIASGLAYATEIYPWLTAAQVNALMYRMLSLNQRGPDNEALTDQRQQYCQASLHYWQLFKVRSSGLASCRRTEPWGLASDRQRESPGDGDRRGCR